MKTIRDLIAMLSLLNLDTPIYECFDGAGNFYFPDPTLRMGTDKNGDKVAILTGKRVNNLEDIKDIVYFTRDDNYFNSKE